MKIERVVVGNLKTNVWLVEGITDEAGTPHLVVIDPGDEAGALLAAVGERVVDAVLLTHGHFDHISAADEVADAWGTFVYMPLAEMDILPELCEDVRQWDMEPPNPIIDFQVKDGEILHLAGLDIEVFHTPGHTPGSSGYLVCDSSADKNDGVIHYFSGDTLFARDLGRTDLLGGDAEKLQTSLERIARELPPETKVYPGHGPSTTIAREAAVNAWWPA